MLCKIDTGKKYLYVTFISRGCTVEPRFSSSNSRFSIEDVSREYIDNHKN